jgi:hypothetical protein
MMGKEIERNVKKKKAWSPHLQKKYSFPQKLVKSV